MAKSVSLPLPGRHRAARRRDAPSLRLPFLLTLPTLLVVFVIFGIPLVYSLALSLHRINMLTQQWVFVGSAELPRHPAQPRLPGGARPHRLFRFGHGDRRADPRLRDGARAQPELPRAQFPAQRGAGALGHGAGRRRRALELDAEWRVRHLQCRAVRPRPDRQADPLAGRRHGSRSTWWRSRMSGTRRRSPRS